ncbi:unnamed protein product [Arctia plantaginis]|uniref:LRRCT domain-containing protein n=1 Tax=Arctia plantaginis TaxID=874455 RepID=A0A8S0Z6J3_ARCPL|nr:unnamed protein product [Arctia plantaginis]
MTRMQLLRSTSLKRFKGISSIVRNASFSSGWLHLAIQGLFAVIIVTSFILILLVALHYSSDNGSDTVPAENRCFTKSCIVACTQIPYYGNFEDDIVFTVSQLPESCSGFYLALHNPMFHHGTLKSDWIPRLRLPIIELSITGGNLNHLTPNAFLHLHTAHIRSLILHDLIIKTWDTDSLVGLTHLEKLWIDKSTIVDVAANVFRSVHNTLESLTISHSRQWDPANITGTMNLPSVTIVDFSNNIFNDVLGKNSFTGLGSCKMLYLNSCNISAIGEGAFDNLFAIETLFLNDNNLVTIPNDLFKNILTITNPTARINLHDNNWHCGCFTNNMRQLVSSDVLLTHPICRSPEIFAGKTFFEVLSHCNYSAPIPIFSKHISPTSKSSIIHINNGCLNGNISSRSTVMKLISPITKHQCPQRHIKNDDLRRISISRSSYPIVSEHSWIQFSFILNVENYSSIQINLKEDNNLGMLWYQSTCPNEVFCIDDSTSTFKIFNIDLDADYVFCPISNISGFIANEKCVTYNLKRIAHTEIGNKLQILFFLLIGGICLVLGAICVYILVRTHPVLLKGSKRILFVKHKTLDALVLPPKVTVRNDSENETHPDLNDDNIFTVPANSGNRRFFRNISMRSNKSSAPSYISAVQPSELQLTEWRMRNNFTTEGTSELTVNSWLYNPDSHHYIDVLDFDTTYESLK